MKSFSLRYNCINVTAEPFCIWKACCVYPRRVFSLEIRILVCSNHRLLLILLLKYLLFILLDMLGTIPLVRTACDYILVTFLTIDWFLQNPYSIILNSLGHFTACTSNKKNFSLHFSTVLEQSLFFFIRPSIREQLMNWVQLWHLADINS